MDSFWMLEELFIGAFLQFPLYFIVGWWIVPLMAICGLLWRLGGWSGGNKWFRRAGVPLMVCGSSVAFGVNWNIFLAAPFMVWLAPSYGETSWLFKITKNNFITRTICFFWYWSAFGIVYAIFK